jgi:hypothetical protein
MQLHPGHARLTGAHAIHKAGCEKSPVRAPANPVAKPLPPFSGRILYQLLAFFSIQFLIQMGAQGIVSWRSGKPHSSHVKVTGNLVDKKF